MRKVIGVPELPYTSSTIVCRVKDACGQKEIPEKPAPGAVFDVSLIDINT